jgi:hypothetical protein
MQASRVSYIGGDATAFLRDKGNALRLFDQTGTYTEVSVADPTHANSNLAIFDSDIGGVVGFVQNKATSQYNLTTGQFIVSIPGNQLNASSASPAIVLLHDDAQRTAKTTDWRAPETYTNGARHCTDVNRAVAIRGIDTAALFEVRIRELRGATYYTGFVRLLPTGHGSSVDAHMQTLRHAIFTTALTMPNAVTSMDSIAVGNYVWVAIGSEEEVCLLCMLKDNSKILQQFTCPPSSELVDAYNGLVQILLSPDDASIVSVAITDRQGGVTIWSATPGECPEVTLRPQYRAPAKMHSRVAAYAVDVRDRDTSVLLHMDGTMTDIVHSYVA